MLGWVFSLNMICYFFYLSGLLNKIMFNKERFFTTVIAALTTAALLGLISLIQPSFIINALGGATQEDLAKMGAMYEFKQFQINQGSGTTTIDAKYPSIAMITARTSAATDSKNHDKRQYIFTNIVIGTQLCSRSDSYSYRTSIPEGGDNTGRDYEIINTCVIPMSPGEHEISVKSDIKNTTNPSGSVSVALFRDPTTR